MDAAALRVVLAACVLTASGPASLAQPVFRGTVTERELVDALTPKREVTDACPPGATCRNINVKAASAPAPSKPAGASLLITFATNSAELTAQARRSLDLVARALASSELSSYRFVIEGHADKRGTDEENDALSQARAEAVRDYLVSVHGISEDRLDPVGKGNREPANRHNVTAPENRRVTFLTRS